MAEPRDSGPALETVGLFATLEEAQEVLDLLVEHKFPAERLAIRARGMRAPLAPQPSSRHAPPDGRRHGRHRTALLGAVFGALLGGTAGLVFSLALLMVPGLLLGALIGALLGSAADAAESVLEPEAGSSPPPVPLGWELIGEREIAARAREVLADVAGRG